MRHVSNVVTLLLYLGGRKTRRTVSVRSFRTTCVRATVVIRFYRAGTCHFRADSGRALRDDVVVSHDRFPREIISPSPFDTGGKKINNEPEKRYGYTSYTTRTTVGERKLFQRAVASVHDQGGSNTHALGESSAHWKAASYICPPPLHIYHPFNGTATNPPRS